MKKHLTFLFQGDSITDCGRNRDEAANTAQQLGVGYPGKVASALAVKHRDIDWTFLNRGISGNRSVDLYARWKIDALNLKPDILSILVGINDTWHEFQLQNGVELDRYECICRELLWWTREALPNVKIILLEPYLIPVPDKMEWFPEVQERAKIIRNLAEETRSEFIPLQSLFEKYSDTVPGTYWSADGVHPTFAGHQLIADAMLPVVEKLLKKEVRK